MVRRLILFGALVFALALPSLAQASFDGKGRRAPQIKGIQGLMPLNLGDNPVLAQRSRRRDHDRARDAVGAGDVLPLGTIMQRVGRRYPGRLLDANLGRGGQGRWIYRLKILTPKDRVRRLAVDAKTGQVLGGGR